MHVAELVLGHALTGVVALEDRTGIDVTFLRSTEFGEIGAQLFELRQHQFVVIVAPGVARDAAWRSWRGFLALPVIERHDHHRACRRQNLLWIAPLLRAPLHPLHFPGCAFA